MKTALMMLALLGTAAATDVVTGTVDNFDGLVAEGFNLVKFYAPWCGHCKKMVPEWEKAATELKGTAKLIDVDATVEESLGSKYGVRGFPTLKAFIEGGDAMDYEGGRSADEIVEWVKKMGGPAVTDVADADALKALTEEFKVVVTGFFAADSEEAKAFDKLAKANRMKYTWAVVNSAELAKAEGASVPGLILYKQFDEGKVVMEEFKVDEVMEFASKASFPVLGEIGPDNYQDYLARKLPLGWLFLGDDEEKTTSAKKAVQEACAGLTGKVSCVYLSGVQYGQMAERIGLSGKTFPSFGIDDEGEHWVFEESKDITVEAFGEWLKDWSAGKIAPFVKSEEAPEEHTVEGLTTLVANTIKELVLDETEKNILIKFYAPWCGHCKSMAPDYAKLAKHFEEDKEVMIADFEATANDAPKQFDVKGFPTLYWVQKGGKPESYDGGRSLDDMKEFIEKNRA